MIRISGRVVVFIWALLAIAVMLQCASSPDLAEDVGPGLSGRATKPREPDGPRRSDAKEEEVIRWLTRNVNHPAGTWWYDGAVSVPNYRYDDVAWIQAGREIEGIVPVLTDLLAEADSRAWPPVVADALRYLGDESCVPALVNALSGGDRELAISAALALGRIGDPKAIGPLCEAARQAADGWVRGYAASALGEFGRPHVLASLGARHVAEIRACVEAILDNEASDWVKDIARDAQQRLDATAALLPLSPGLGASMSHEVVLWPGDDTPTWPVRLLDLGRCGRHSWMLQYKDLLDDIAWLYVHRKREFLAKAGDHTHRAELRSGLADIFDQVVGSQVTPGRLGLLLRSLESRSRQWRGLTGLERTLIQSLVVNLVKTGDRENLVELLALYCPPRVRGCEIERYLVGEGTGRLEDPILVLCDAFEVSAQREARGELVAALIDAFSGPWPDLAARAEQASPSGENEGNSERGELSPIEVKRRSLSVLEWEREFVDKHRQLYLQYRGRIVAHPEQYSSDHPLFTIKEPEELE